MTERFIKHIEGGGTNPKSRSRIVMQKGSCVCHDANGGIGYVIADKAMSQAIELAKQHGLALVTARNSNYIGACLPYVRRAAQADCIGMCTTVTRGMMAPWGGKDPLIGNNPFALAAPVKDHFPFIADFGSCVMAMLKIVKALDLNEQISEGWALDKNGNMTTDPEAAFNGSLLPIGDHKGYGLAMSLEILSVVLSGGSFSSELEGFVKQTTKSAGTSFTMIVIDISTFSEVQTFKQKMKEYVERLICSGKRPEYERIYYPGEIEGETYQRRIKEGIPIDERDREMFQRLATVYKIAELKSI
jgi:LDH2 family malate/lactate/ureidoglycolate dehydrogenase